MSGNSDINAHTNKHEKNDIGNTEKNRHENS